MWQPWGGKQPKAPDFIKEEDVADQVASATGSSRRGQTHAQDTLDYTETQLRAMRPCSLCKGRRKGLSHCIRSGHVPGSVSSRTAVGGGVDFLVTSDKDLLDDLSLKEALLLHGIRVLPPHEFLN